jgi:hypothetical protein
MREVFQNMPLQNELSSKFAWGYEGRWGGLLLRSGGQ